ncbi:MAG: transglycosylase SLT domain-containing protein, partial [Clostridia bacterium]|nr:transglycosylase SLT domain-containing protein [Clostridia bacterium]
MNSSKRSAIALCVAVAIIIACVAALPTVCRQYLRAIYPVAYSDSVLAAAAEYGIAPSLIYAVIHTESHFKTDARSSAGAKGLMQLTDSTFQWALKRA